MEFLISGGPFHVADTVSSKEPPIYWYRREYMSYSIANILNKESWGLGSRSAHLVFFIFHVCISVHFIFTSYLGPSPITSCYAPDCDEQPNNPTNNPNYQTNREAWVNPRAWSSNTRGWAIPFQTWARSNRRRRTKRIIRG